MEEDVREQRRDHSSLRRAGAGIVKLPAFDHARVQSLADESQKHSISHPLAEHLLQLRVIQRVEVLPKVDLEDPSASHLDQVVLQIVERIVRRTTWPKTVRAIQKILLVD